MKEIKVGAGEHIYKACERLAANAPAFMVFNDVRIEARGGETSADLHAVWQAESDRRHAEYIASDEYKKRQAENERRDREDARIRDEALARIEASGVRTRYPWTEAMGEISGFGGGYENACRNMVYAGLLWLEERPHADLRAMTYRNVYGLLNAESEDAKALEKAVLSACPDCSGAMHHVTMSACLYIAKNGWAKYVEGMSKRAA